MQRSLIIFRLNIKGLVVHFFWCYVQFDSREADEGVEGFAGQGSASL